jgi:hypothetical protein
MRKILLLLFFHLSLFVQGQMNNPWMIGYGNWATRTRIVFDSTNYLITQENRKMGFEGTEATISDANGNLLMSSNGVWIADATGDTMMNGSGLNPSWDVNAHPRGLLNDGGNIFLPLPNDSNKYILIHEAYFDTVFNYSYGGGVHLSKIDISANGGLGAVISKNDTLINDTVSYGNCRLSSC